MAANIAKINYLNIGLILISCVAAYMIPFELFLISYAVLGPLHYLTEISWLHERQYFTTAKYDFVFLLALCITLTVGAFLFNYAPWGNGMIFIAFFSAPLLLLIKNIQLKIFGCLALVITGIMLFNGPSNYHSNWWWILVILLPTVIHVYVFTGAFMLYGSLKEKGNTGYVSFVVFLICSLIYFFYDPGFDYQIHPIAYDKYVSGPFSSVNIAMYKVFDLADVQTSDRRIFHIFYTDLGITIMRFIAFAYTYHYLNWFSKTTIIGWHKQSKLRLGIIAALWIASVTLYYLDYSMGFKWLFMLSMLHVFLEFPLNYKTFITIGQGIGNTIAGKRQSV